MAADRTSASASADAALAACILAVDAFSIGGVSVKARAGPEREQFVAFVRALMQPDRPFRRLPLNIGDDRLLGGLDLAATLQARRPVLDRGLLAEADLGILIAPMAERLSQPLAARLAAAIDSGEVTIERDGFGVTADARIALIALDEGMTFDEMPPQALLDRLAIHLDMTGLKDGSLDLPFALEQIAEARQRLAAVRVGDDVTRALCCAAVELGIVSVRVPVLAIKVARIHAALSGRSDVNEEDTIVAARLVLSPRATQLPAAESGPAEDQEQQEADSSNDRETDSTESDQREPEDDGPLADIVLEAAAAAIPSGLLEKLKATMTTRAPATSSGRAGAPRTAALRGRPIGARRSDIKRGVRLHLVETLRAAAPWQTSRRKQFGAVDSRVAIRREDFRIVRFKHRSETATIFVVDASGSAAMHRLAEAKGAVELLLADCYIRRDQVAMISFRGKVAELILPPTRSLARAKRTLAALPGGGGTPLAAAIDAGLLLADTMRRRGIMPTLVFLTDGRANVGRDASGNRGKAQDEAYAAARVCRDGRLSSIVIDTSSQPGPAAERLAAEIGGRYLPLPYADANTISRAIRRVTPAVPAAAER